MDDVMDKVSKALAPIIIMEEAHMGVGEEIGT